MKIYSNKQDALKAIEEYSKRLDSLFEELGVWEESEDSCVSVYKKAHYYDADGKVKFVTE